MRFPELGSRAKALRIGHVAIALVELSSLTYIWFCALSGRRDGLLVAALAALSVQGVALVIGRGNCPLGPVQKRLGDPEPLFELVLPPRAAKAAIPALIAVALGGAAILALRGLQSRHER
jgi:hypothetical protein